MSQDVCPWNVRFARENRVADFEPRPFIARKDAATLARDLLALTPDEFRTAFKGSPMKRAKLRGLQRNADVVLGNVGGTRPGAPTGSGCTAAPAGAAGCPREGSAAGRSSPS
jgi:epoxyqueuosine reductase QueG